MSESEVGEYTVFGLTGNIDIQIYMNINK
jgi:hypothetical protein